MEISFNESLIVIVNNHWIYPWKHWTSTVNVRDLVQFVHFVNPFWITLSEVTEYVPNKNKFVPKHSKTIQRQIYVCLLGNLHNYKYGNNTLLDIDSSVFKNINPHLKESCSNEYDNCVVSKQLLSVLSYYNHWILIIQMIIDFH